MIEKEYQDVADSFALAMAAEGIPASLIVRIKVTVDDAVGNNMDLTLVPTRTYEVVTYDLDRENEDKGTLGVQLTHEGLIADLFSDDGTLQGTWAIEADALAVKCT